MSGLPAGVDEVVFRDLKARYDSGGVVLFAGAGVSMAAGLPSWQGLAAIVIERMRSASVAQSAIDEAVSEVRRDRLIEALSVAKHTLGLELDLTVERELDDRRRKIAVPEIARVIGELGPKLAGAVTTNLDCLLERALGDEWTVTTEPTGALGDPTRKHLLKAHGTIERRDTWVLTRGQYDSAMFGRPDLQAALTGLFTMRTLLFVGTSLVDDHVIARLGALRALSGGHPPMHFAILEGPISEFRRRQLGDAGVRLLVYTNASGTHAEVTQISRHLGGLSSKPLASSPPAPKAPSPPPPKARVEVMVLAAAKDTAMRDALVKALKPLADAGLVHLRDERDVPLGSDRVKTLDRFVAEARVVLALLSADFLASDEQMRLARNALAASSNGKVVVPVIGRACAWDMGPFAHLPTLPADGKPISSRDVDAAYLEIFRGLRARVEGL